MAHARLATGLLTMVLAAMSLTACSSAPDDGKVRLRLGYFPNVTHATAIAGVEKGFFASALGDGVVLEPQQFNAGPEAIEALFSGAIDAAYVGPNPTVNGFVQSKGAAVRVISGATSGGAFLVVRPDINAVADLKGRTLATPQLGNTQDVALRYWLRNNGLTSNLAGGGDVKITPQDNSRIVDSYNAGAIDGAWVPEPTATRLRDLGAKVLVDEKNLWPSGRFVTTNLIVSPDFLARHRDVVKRLVQGQVKAGEWVNANTSEAQTVVGEAVGRLSGKPLPQAVVQGAWANLTFTNDPVAASLTEGARHAADVGTLKGGAPDLRGLFDLSVLNEVLREKGLPEVPAP